VIGRMTFTRDDQAPVGMMIELADGTVRELRPYAQEVGLTINEPVTLTVKLLADGTTRPLTIHPAGVGAGGYIREVEPSAVPVETLGLAVTTVRAVSAALRMPLPKLRWIELCAADDPDAVGPWRHACAGFTPMIPGPLEIFIHRGLGDRVARTTAHECRHAWQLWTGSNTVFDHDSLERDARDFDQFWMNRSSK
jgi:hypothetical protein